MKKNFLIIGSSSLFAKDYILKLNQISSYCFYGITSKKLNAIKLYKNIWNYTDLEEIRNIKFDRVLIIASRLPYENVSKQEFFDVNNQILKTLNKIKITKNLKITFISSYNVFDKNLQFIDDNTTINPSDMYGESKAILEHKITGFCLENNISCYILRMPTFLYQGGSRNFVCALTIATKNGEVFSLSNPEEKISALFDVSYTTLFDAIDPYSVKTINCGVNPDLSFKELGDIATSYGLKKIIWINSERGPTQVDLTKLKRALNFKPSARLMIEK